MHRHPGSFRDPAGYVLRDGDGVIRTIHRSYQREYDRLVQSGLYDALSSTGRLISHEEISDHGLDAYKVIRPRQIPFVSYPYEWSFGQLRDGALLMLECLAVALDHGMWLKDASAFNVQFSGTSPVLIDTLSFASYLEGRPWPGYRQFCQHFLAPLALASKRDARLLASSQQHLDGIPLDLAARLLPFRAWLSLGLTLHIFVHAHMQKRHYRSEASKERSLSRRGLENLVAHLTNVVAGLPSPRPRSQWLDYADIHSYTQETIAAKRAAVERFVHALSPRRVLDIGANTGEFSMLAASHAGFVVATDADPDCVDEAYRRCRQAGIRNVLPLVVDITNPAPPVGWAGRERESFLDRARVDVVIALAIVHHLAIGASIPLRLISEYFARLGKFAIVEFVPPDDPQAGRIARGKSGLHHEYSQEAFESAMQSCFELVESQDLAPGGRRLYLLRSRLFEETGDDQVSSL